MNAKNKLTPAVVAKPLMTSELVIIPKLREECFQKLVDSLCAVHDNVLISGKLLVHLVDMDLESGRTNTYELIIAAVPNIDPRFLGSLELVGRGKMHPMLLSGGGQPQIDAIITNRGLKMKYQTILFEGGMLAVAVPSPSDEMSFLVRQKTKAEMKPEEMKRGVDPKNGEWRTVEKQWELLLAERKAKKTAKARRWMVVGDKIKIKVINGLFTFNDLVAMAKAVEPKPGDLEAALKENQIAKA